VPARFGIDAHGRSVRHQRTSENAAGLRMFRDALIPDARALFDVISVESLGAATPAGRATVRAPVEMNPLGGAGRAERY